jgi:hypothetical protein
MDNRKEVLFTLVMILLIAALGFGIIVKLMDSGKPPKRVIHTFTMVGEDMREQVQCEFEEPLKHVTLIMHYYDTNEEMYADYVALADPAEHEEIWGWSACEFQPQDDAAWCDIFVVKPTHVHADMNIDTLGHEVTHATCGGFHE